MASVRLAVATSLAALVLAGSATSSSGSGGHRLELSVGTCSSPGCVELGGDEQSMSLLQQKAKGERVNAQTTTTTTELELEPPAIDLEYFFGSLHATEGQSGVSIVDIDVPSNDPTYCALGKCGQNNFVNYIKGKGFAPQPVNGIHRYIKIAYTSDCPFDSLTKTIEVTTSVEQGFANGLAFTNSSSATPGVLIGCEAHVASTTMFCFTTLSDKTHQLVDC
mmetsp:Transcript_2364/g.5899  ORF Transcript_2364/g.5899 Transcript_2364/m.5899 type:complete len:221 (-) Transcript_2364:128-790(-)